MANLLTAHQIEAEVKALINEVRDHPEGRFKLRSSFYERFGFGPDRGFGKSELVFMRWEIQRGVLNPLQDQDQPGSPWWRQVNESLLYHSTLAGRYAEAGISLEKVATPVRAWLEYIADPTARTWYRAHNTSIVQGYLEHEDLIKQENQAEQLFVNMILYRLLYAQAMVEDTPEGFGDLGVVLANPVSPAVDVLVHLPDFYPRHYPLTKKDIIHVMHKGHTLPDIAEKIFDEALILPLLNKLYRQCAHWLASPELTKLVRGNQPNYPKLPPVTKKKIAILGGGVGAMIAAFALSDPGNSNAHTYDITLYQIGWRLGGKGASGRNVEPEYHNRIQEHGLHIWFGFYDNAFRAIRKCYDELTSTYEDGKLLRAPDAPLGTWEAAFHPFNTAVIKQEFQDKWESWFGHFPTNELIPGDGGLLPLWTYGHMALEALFKSFRKRTTTQPTSPTGNVPEQFVSGALYVFGRLVTTLENAVLHLGLQLLKRLHVLSWTLDAAGSLMMLVVGVFMRWYWRFVKDRVETDIHVNRAWTVANYTFASFRGIFADKLLERGFDSINHFEFRDWVAKYALDDGGVLLNSAFMLNIYDGSFAYVNGDNSTPTGATFPPNANMEAGTTLRAGIRFFMTYKGAPVWKMQAGMGDTIFGPLYLVLKARGVKFKFFHRVTAIQASANKEQIDQIEMIEQVKLVQDEYAPLIDVKGLPCWPNQPLWNQLVDGDRLRQEKVDLESYCEQPPGEALVLQRGQDFDEVVLGISLGALPYICEDLIEKSAKWKNMVDHIPTVRTQAYQLWLRPTAFELGWTKMQRPVLTAYEYASSNPINTWADMSHLIKREPWPNAHYPENIAYFCGPMSEDTLPITKWGPRVDCNLMDQKEENEKVRARAIEMLSEHIEPLWPDALVPESLGAYPPKLRFKWDLLVDARPDAPSGEARIDSQYWIANVKPSERYVLSVAGSSQYRLPSNDPHEFQNLYLAGDWTDNHLNFGCVEAATMSGLMAASALSGYPNRDQIFGLDF